MPGSVRENDALVREFVKTHGIYRILDVGAGSGTYARLLADLDLEIDAIEVWKPYISDYNLEMWYRYVYNHDVRDTDVLKSFGKTYDLVIFGDILEHMSEEDAVRVWSEAGSARWRMASVPIIHYPQGAEFGNPYEVHVQEHLTEQKMNELFGPFDYGEVYDITGTFIKRGN